MPKYIYLAGSADFDRYKIGFSSNPEKRLQAMQTSCPFKIYLLGFWKGGREEEKMIHTILAVHQVSGEWFKADMKIIVGAVSIACKVCFTSALRAVEGKLERLTGKAKRPANKWRNGRFNPNKPPAVLGHKWSASGAGFDCRKFWIEDGKTHEVWIGYLGKKKLSEFRSLSADREELRELVRNWILEKESEKGK